MVIKDLGELSIRRLIFQGDSLFPLLFVITMLPFSSVLNELGAGYQLSKEEGKMTHLLFMDDLKLYGRNENEINSLIHIVRAPVPGKPISANRRLNPLNPGIKFILRLVSVPESTISAIQRIN